MRGGKRSGSGRKPGGAQTRTRKVAEACHLTGETPLEFMLAVMRHPMSTQAEKMDAAKSAAPYMHPRLNAIEGSLNLTHRQEEDLAKMEERMMAKAQANGDDEHVN